jgi:hypothetical protein
MAVYFLKATCSQPYSFAASFEIPQINPPQVLCVEITEVNGQQDENPANNIRCINLDADFVVVEPYPNPAEQVINLQVVVSRKDFLSITVYDATGKLIKEVYSGSVAAGLNKFSFDISSLSEGTYFCKYSFSAKNYSKAADSYFVKEEIALILKFLRDNIFSLPLLSI